MDFTGTLLFDYKDTFFKIKKVEFYRLIHIFLKIIAYYLKTFYFCG
ncbi:hypothetical protein CCAND93_1350009 [Capnocytophaga canis]|uniref:Uncharacterized protein n=1 Tax=Capnocytophaga canis TaxID=1848903 RepID=A0A0B7IGR9_9FLAO|nr:hypothetical protein CCAND93_1350009 [Capnocytophaga canis]